MQTTFLQLRKHQYSPEMTDKSAIHNLIFGTHYRKIYGTLIDSKTASLDTLYGGLTPQRAGGGHQTKSLRLTDPDGKST
jgi:hypothetical protein